MLKDEAISSVSRFITELSRSARKNNDVKSITAKGGSKCVAKAIVQEMIDTFLRNVSKALKRGRHYICKDFSRY
jgi:nucleoid DNA-binding protein